MTREVFLNTIISQRDYSGNSTDEYLQNLETFYFHSQRQNKEDDFLSLVEKSINENKKIVLDSAFEKEMEEVNYDDIPFEKLTLA